MQLRLLILKPLQMAITKRSKILPRIVAGRNYIAPSAYETWFITDALTYEDLILPSG
jgi:hypothetical protein